ncbi:MAG: arylsulfatase A-like enzyme [Rhodothermales bacterium]|jgi:arylsulfatase A-like enzyme
MRTTIFLLLAMLTATAFAKKPNIILVITDDQGYGDIGAHGNTMINTPAMDKLHGESLRLTNYHVDPTCAPTRAALMSGRYSANTGIWHTIMGRSMMHPDEETIAEILKKAGYATGMFGKWHLGDNYPLRPEDQGFDYTVRHGAGGIGQGPDYWDNDYFDDTYWRNSIPTKYTGYCTDVFFREATGFIERNKDTPFFAYITTNAPHGPLIVDPKYAEPYEKKGVDPNMAKFYGMIENIDENIAALRTRLEAWALTENTIFIFTTDNGSATGWRARGKNATWKGFNAGMRAGKGSEYDGGHRVPFFMHWPKGGFDKGRDFESLCAHVDIQATLAEFCGVAVTGDRKRDGVSLVPAIRGNADYLRSRSLMVQSQRVQVPKKWRKCSTMSGRWRLINGKELYDIEADPAQTKDIASQHAEVVQRLRADYDKVWADMQPAFQGQVRFGLGADAENPARLMSHDLQVKDQRESPWHQNHVRNGHIGNGTWPVDITRDGRYSISLYRWPRHLKKAMESTHARLKLAGVDVEKDVAAGDTVASFEVKLKKGPASLQTWLTNPKGQKHTAYFVWVEWLGN